MIFDKNKTEEAAYLPNFEYSTGDKVKSPIISRLAHKKARAGIIRFTLAR